MPASRRSPALASGYLYYVSLKGVTGSALRWMSRSVVGQARSDSKAHPSLPLAVGFGIRDAASAAQVGAVADGVIVGSALVSLIEQHQATPDLAAGAAEGRSSAEMRAALDALAAGTPSGLIVAMTFARTHLTAHTED